MITIAKGKKTMTVTNTAFHNFYENAGWKVEGDVKENKVVNKPAKKEVEPEPVVDSEPSDEDWEDAMNDDEVEKPLSEMTRAELEVKATELGIEVKKDISNKQLRELIKKAI